MYFKNKFNKEIQSLIRSMDTIGAKSRLGDINTNLFQVEEVIGQKSSKKGVEAQSDKKHVLVYPLVMYDKITSSNSDDVAFVNSDLDENIYSGVLIAEKRDGTIIKCGRESK